MPLTVVPDTNIPLPDDFSPEEPTKFQDKVKVAAKTVKTLLEAGADYAINDEQRAAADDIFNAYTTNPNTTPATGTKSLHVPSTVAHLAVMLNEYDHQVVQDAVQLRRFITNKLIEETSMPDPRVRLKALELLGKMSDVGLFTEKTELTIKSNGTEDLENRIRSKLLKVMQNATAVDASFEVLEREIDTSTPLASSDKDD